MGRARALGMAIQSLWLGWTLFMWLAATRSFRTVDRVLSQPDPDFRKTARPLGPDLTRVVLRHI